MAGELRDAKVESIAVCLLHAHLYPEHERLLGEVLRAELPDVPISLSSEILREQQEYERTATTAVNAYIRPLMAGYLDDIRTGIADVAGAAPLQIMQSSGGVMTAADAAVRPVYALESGPAAGRRRVARARAGARLRERDHVRHGRHDREDVADRGRPRLAQPGVRGRRGAFRREQVAPGQR